MKPAAAARLEPLPTNHLLVCAACLTVSCRDGVFRCERSGEAGVVARSIEQLHELNLEHPDWWENGRPS